MKEILSKIIANKADLNGLAEQILMLVPENRFFVFRGEMGAGKTTFIKAFCKALNVKEEPSSPTYSLINQYQKSDGEPVYHFDFYRIQNPEEAYDYGYEEYFFSGNYCFVEWAERIWELLPQSFVEVKISSIDQNTRKVSVIKV